MAELRIERLSKRFGDRLVLDDVDLLVAPGTLVAILGRSGSGKTTLLRIVCGFENADGGRVLIDGEVVAGGARRDQRPEWRRIGYVPQEGALFPHLTIADNVLFGLPRHARRRREGAADLLRLVQLPPAAATRFPHELSGGEQQRAALARTLATRPRLVLLDEPFASLDAALRVDTRDTVAAALAQAGATAVLVTHDQAEALSMGTQVAVLRRGAMVQVAAPAVLYRRPVDLELARFVGEAVVLAGEACGSDVTCALGRLVLAAPVAAGPVDVMLRPEQLALVAVGEGPRARVVRVAFYGPDALVRLALGAHAELVARVPGHLAPEAGREVAVAVTGAVAAFAAAHVADGTGPTGDGTPGR